MLKIPHCLLQSPVIFQEGSSTQHRIKSLVKTLQLLTYNYVCRSLFKADRLMFALHMVHGMFPDMFAKNVSAEQFVDRYTV